MREGWESWLFCRLQNSPYDCVFKYVRASSQTKGLERGWKQRARLDVWGSRASLAWESYATLYRFFYWFWEKKTDCSAVKLFWYMLIQDCLTLCNCFFRSTCVCTFFFRHHTSPIKKKTVGPFRDFVMEEFLPLLLRKKKVLGRIWPVLYSFLITFDLVSLSCFKFLLSLLCQILSLE